MLNFLLNKARTDSIIRRLVSKELPLPSRHLLPLICTEMCVSVGWGLNVAAYIVRAKGCR